MKIVIHNLTININLKPDIEIEQIVKWTKKETDADEAWEPEAPVKDRDELLDSDIEYGLDEEDLGDDSREEEDEANEVEDEEELLVDSKQGDEAEPEVSDEGFGLTQEESEEEEEEDEREEEEDEDREAWEAEEVEDEENEDWFPDEYEWLRWVIEDWIPELPPAKKLRKRWYWMTMETKKQIFDRFHDLARDWKKWISPILAEEFWVSTGTIYLVLKQMKKLRDG